MIKNYLKIALRNILNKKVYAVINLLGLAVGIACSLAIVIYVQFELGFDKFHSQSDRIYRVNSHFSSGDHQMTTANTPSAVLPTLLDEFPEVENGVRVFRATRPEVVKVEDKAFQENDVYYADSTFFEVFDFELISGNPKQALTRPNNVIFTESSAIKYFGTTDIINQTVLINGEPNQITAVSLDPPNNTQLQFDFIRSFATVRRFAEHNRWDAANFYTFLVLNPFTDIEATGRKLQEVVEREMGPFDGGVTVSMALVPLGDIHLKSVVADELERGDITYVYIFLIIALLIIVIACVNYMNLATARSVYRAREVGMRKVLGAHRSQLFFQFIAESALITATSFILALVLVASLLPFFAEIAGRPLDLSLYSQPLFWFALVLSWLFVSFLAGAYPALILSSYAPGTVLKSGFKNSTTGSLLRRILVIFQFSVSIFLFIGSVVIYQQLDFMQAKDLGYEKDNLLILPADQTTRSSFNSFRTELMRLPEVQNVAMTNESISDIKGGYDLTVAGLTAEDGILITALIASPEFVETAGLEILAGADFNATDLTLSETGEPVFNILINEETAKYLYLTPEQAIGQQTNLNGREGVIKGVVSNFHFRSLKEKILPMAIFIEPVYFSQTLVNISSQNTRATIEAIQANWEKFFDHRPFEMRFLDQEYDALYRAENQLKQIYSLFTILAIFIGSLGLFGLVSYATVQRAKEIGIRKILGASIQSIIAMLSGDFVKLVMMGFVLAAPLAYWSINGWLSSFEYHVSFSWEVIAITLASQVVLTLAVISWQSIKAALTNPVEAIRNE